MTISSMKLKKKLISQAIDVLRETKSHNEESGKKALFEDDSSTLFLQVMLKKIPKTNKSQMIKVNLPHSLLKSTDEICLITGDTNKHYRKAETEPDVLLYKALLDKHGVTEVSKIVTLRQLRTDYKPYADKQKLLAAYDVFLADNKIYECLPGVLGKFFYKKRKFPLQINMKSSNLKQQIEKALSVKRVYVTGNGNSCCSEVAYLNMSNSEILANVMEMINTLSKEMPGAWDNIMGLYLKTARSNAIPIYVSYGNPNDVILQEDDESEDDAVMDELSTKPNVDIKIYKDGRMELLSSKKSQEASFGEIMEEKIDSQEKNENKKSQNSEMKEERKKSGKNKKQKSLEDEIDESEKSMNEEENVLVEDIGAVNFRKERKKSGKKKKQKNLEDETDESEKSMNEEENVLVEDIGAVDFRKERSKSGKKKKQKSLADESERSKEEKNVLVEDICVANTEKERKKSGKKKKQKSLDDEIDESERSMKEEKNVLVEDICVVNPEKERKKSGKKKKQKSLDDEIEDICVANRGKDLHEKKKKSAFKRKRELSESGSREKELFLTFKSPEQETKKRKVDSSDLKSQQPFKNARKKNLKQKTKRNFKA